jgi:murein DD-endopeptidase MepM/ murein hydrolase activator NlpD
MEQHAMKFDPEDRRDDADELPGLDEWLRREEPPIADDDTSPSRRMDPAQRLAAEEPAPTADDTSPNPVLSAHDRLALDEPPITLEDTNPSRPIRPAPPPQHGPGRALWIAVTLAALALIAVGAGIILNAALSDDEQPDTVPVAVDPTATHAPTEASSNTQEPTSAPTTAPTVTAEPEATEPPVEVAQVPEPEDAAPAAREPIVLPTAGADTIAAALAAPLPSAPETRVIRREAAPFTVRRENTRSGVIPYTVEPGDTLESIAAKFGLNDHYTIIWSNSSTKLADLEPGTQLNIMPEDGVYHEVTEEITIRELAEKYNVDPYVIIDSEYNDSLFGSVPETRLPVGMWVVIPGAEGERFNQRIAGSGGFTEGSAAGGLLSGTYSLWGCTANLQGGTEPYNRPLGGYTWMRGFIPGYHDGVDLAGRDNQPVLAAGAGTVVYAGWNNNGYGRVVVIAHSSSFSLYGHLNSINVRCGQYVDQGQVIGGMGNTGNSSGTHLHFEVRDVGFNPLNPQNYIGF